MPRGEWQWHICRGRGCWVMGHQGQGLCPFALTLVSFGLNHCNLPAQACDHSVEETTQAYHPPNDYAYGLYGSMVRPQPRLHSSIRRPPGPS
ncbi:hypothetical protein F2Q70_00031394 [Brassica cretica]|uniref:Uncharacterized protein n=2 Tax=Brassica cretica TaxID=69181 RepID=A0A8S9FHQ7_BRACR|nr:hypothetical protein F2Q70_00031394 [Brassica cretica]KAF2550054.1 hypothetical protein F2Q68_00035810 [Brassica cretica]KAF3596944.1 hypothetical protein DY000_02024573 [Brassica cretica]